ncbi:MAG: hypothetical protein V3U84_07055 [Thiotrichaceae bacterium]
MTHNQDLIDPARHSLEAMSKVLKCNSLAAVKAIAEPEIASLIKYIDDLEQESADADIVVNIE